VNGVSGRAGLSAAAPAEAIATLAGIEGVGYPWSSDLDLRCWKLELCGFGFGLTEVTAGLIRLECASSRVNHCIDAKVGFPAIPPRDGIVNSHEADDCAGGGMDASFQTLGFPGLAERCHGHVSTPEKNVVAVRDERQLRDREGCCDWRREFA
jgi:hypothetical protein